MKRRNWGDVMVEVDGNEASIFLHSKSNLSLRGAEDLIEDLRYATAWIRDQQRREKDEQDTPLLPL
jgi:hypothetical protein